MSLIDVKSVEAEARKELSEERSEKAKDRLKSLYRDREKAQLAVKNIDRQITAYLADIADIVTYEEAGVEN